MAMQVFTCIVPIYGTERPSKALSLPLLLSESVRGHCKIPVDIVLETNISKQSGPSTERSSLLVVRGFLLSHALRNPC